MIGVKNKYILLLMLCGLPLLMWVSCNWMDNSQLPDVSDIHVDMDIQRFDQAFLELDSTNYEAKVELLKQSFPVFLPFFMETLMDFEPVSDSTNTYEEQLLGFATNPDIARLNDSCQAIFADMSIYEQELEQAFKYFKHYFPQKTIPAVVSCNSAFNLAAFTLDASLIGLSLEMHLGEGFELYERMSYPRYMMKRMTPEYLTINAMKVYGRELYPMESRRAKLIDEMIYQGKILYFLSLVLPEKEEYLRVGYTPTQLEWCEQNEANIWAHFVEQNLLYETESKKYKRYTVDGPTTMGMPADSPGNIASWVGLRIVESYMKANPETELEELLNINEGQEILRRSGYKPRR